MNRSLRVPRGTRGNPALVRPLTDFAAAVVRLHALDPVTTELVRLHCARHHDCRT